MKKVIALLTAVILVLSLGTVAFAANFTPSVEQKEAPTVTVPSKAPIKEEIKAQIKNEDTVAVVVHSATDKVAEEISSTKLLVTSVAKKEEVKELPKEAKEDLDKAFKDFSDKTKKIEQVIPAEVAKVITEEVKKEVSEEKTVNDLIVRDLFDVSLLDEKTNELVVDEEHHLLLTFNLGVKKGEYITAIKLNPATDKWETIRDVVNNGDGTVTCEFDHLCSIAFLVEKTEENSGVADSNSSQTGDNSVSLYVWVAIAVAAGALITVLVVAKKKANSAQ